MYPVIDVGAELPPAFRDPGPPSRVLVVDEAAVTANSRRWIEDALDALR
jgi:thiamine transport system substrate-binding protein